MNIENSMEVIASDENQLENLCKNAVELIDYARSIAAKQVNVVQLMTYFTLGKWIVEVQQNGEQRAKYGKKVLETLSVALNQKFGTGYSVATLTNMRKFYQTYQDRISEPLVTKFLNQKSQPLVTIFDEDFPFRLSWSHYLILMRIQDEKERNFYEIESQKGKRSVCVGIFGAG